MGSYVGNLKKIFNSKNLAVFPKSYPKIQKQLLRIMPKKSSNESITQYVKLEAYLIRISVLL